MDSGAGGISRLYRPVITQHAEHKQLLEQILAVLLAKLHDRCSGRVQHNKICLFARLKVTDDIRQIQTFSGSQGGEVKPFKG